MIVGTRPDTDILQDPFRESLEIIDRYNAPFSREVSHGSTPRQTSATMNFGTIVALSMIALGFILHLLF